MLYAQYIHIVAGLPDDTTMWSITLCFAYFSALTTNLKDRMDEGEFIMLALNNMVTKASQIDGLRIVRISAVRLYKAMHEEEKRICRLLPQMNKSRGRDGGSIYQYDDSDNSNNQVQDSNQFLFHNLLEAETSLSRYSGVSNGDTTGGPKISSRAGTNSCQYPYNPDNPAYLSKFPIGFKVFFQMW